MLLVLTPIIGWRDTLTRRFRNPGIAKKRLGIDPCQDFFGEFDQMLIDQPKVITFPKRWPFTLNFVKNSLEFILILQNMLTCALFIDCRKSHLRTFCCQIHQRAKIGGGGHHFYDDIINFGWCFLISIKRKFGILQTSPLFLAILRIWKHLVTLPLLYIAINVVREGIQKSLLLL